MKQLERKTAVSGNKKNVSSTTNSAENSGNDDSPIEKIPATVEDSTSSETSPVESEEEEKEATPETAEADAETKDEGDEDTVPKEKAEESSQPEEEAYYESLVEKAIALSKSSEWSFGATEFEHIAHKWSEGPQTEGLNLKELHKQVEEAKETFFERRRAHYEELNKLKQENLEKKKALLSDLSDLISNKKWSFTKDFGRILAKWEHIRPIPQSEAEVLEARFKELVEEFEEHKIDRLVKKLEKEQENLILKLSIMDKMKGLLDTANDSSNFEILSTQLGDLQQQWRKVGKVPAEKLSEVYEYFNKLQASFDDLRFKHDKQYRKEVEKFLQQKKKLISEAEALIHNENLAEAAQIVNRLHKQWKKIGNLPKNDENELWEIFKAATDAFNQKKSENLDELKQQEQDNYEEKLKLVERARSLSESDEAEWSDAHNELQGLMAKWKEIGPVPRKKSGKIWKQFKSAMDAFYDKRRESIKDERNEQKENLNRKKEIISKIEELANHEDPALAVEETKKLQAEFKEIGYVPIKTKNKIWKQYREACDAVYSRFRAVGSNLGKEKQLAAQGIQPTARKSIITKENEINTLKRKIQSLKDEVLQYSEAQTYFKPTSKGKGLQDEIQLKIDKANKEIESLDSKLNQLFNEVDTLKQPDEDKG